MDPRLDKLFDDATLWKAESVRLRRILSACELKEEFKWGKACYSFNGKNIAIIQRMKEHLALMFFKGALLKDQAGVLEKPGENSRSGRRVLFRTVRDVDKLKAVLKDYVSSAIEIELAGLKVDKPTELALVAELEEELTRNAALKSAFNGLTKGRQRGYNLYFAAAKQSSTRRRRITKYAEKILSGKGLRD